MSIDLRDFPFMPLYTDRLQRSKAWLLCKRDPALAFYMLNLWMRSWHEVPAGSLEDDDDVLADAAMCDPKTWAKIKDRVLRGWERKDGRISHSVVTEIAAESWTRKQEQRQRTEAARHARSQRRNSAPTNTATVSVTERSTENATEPVTSSVTENVTASKGQGQGQRKQAAREPLDLIEHVTPCPSTGRPTVGGYYLDRTQERVFEAAHIDDARWTGHIKPLIAWIAEGIEPDTIVATVRKCAERPGYSVPSSLSYFDKPVREAHGKVAA